MSDLEVSSSSTIVGDRSFDNELIVKFTPSKPMSPTRSGKIEIELPDWVNVNNNIEPMYDPAALNKCYSDELQVTNSGLQGKRISITYENMLQTHIDPPRAITVNCKQFRNPIY